MKKHHGKEGMIDNRIVNENHQGGIERVLQRGHDKRNVEGHNGKMGSTKSTPRWSRRGDSLTPRKG